MKLAFIAPVKAVQVLLMSHRSSTVSSAAPWGLANAFTYRLKHSMIGSQLSGGEYVPLSRRNSDQLLANAAELRHMARTATTADVVKALTTLANRYAALAAKRRAEEDDSNSLD
jgi:hypothetical protein